MKTLPENRSPGQMGGFPCQAALIGPLILPESSSACPKYSSRWTYKTVRRCSTSVVIREMKLKPEWEITSPLSERPSPVNPQTSVGEDVERRGPLHTGIGLVNWCSHYAVQRLLKKLRCTAAILSSNSWYLTEDNKNTSLKRHRHPSAHCSITSNSEEMETTQMSVTEEQMKKRWCVYTEEYYSATERMTSSHLQHEWI